MTKINISQQLRYVAALAFVLAATAAGAVTIENTAGALSSLLTDNEETELTLTGTMNVADFDFIHNHLNKLETVDLSGVEIVAEDNASDYRLEVTQNGAAGRIADYAFFAKEQLREVTLPTSLTAIGTGAFAGCSQLTTIALPATLEYIGDMAFYETGLTALVVPQSVQSMGAMAFAHCPNLATAVINGTVVGKQAFKNDAQLSQVTLGTATTVIGVEAFVGATALAQLDITAATQLERVSDWALHGVAVDAVVLPATVNYVGEGAFNGIASLAQVSLPQSLNEISAYLFAGTQVSPATLVHEGVTAVGDYAFYNIAQEVDTVFLPTTLERIGSHTFAGTIGVKNYNVPTAWVPELGEMVWDGVNQSVVNVKTADNDLSTAFAQTDQWQEFHILRKYLLGDVNDDGKVNVTDVVVTQAYILRNNPAVFIFDAADLDENNRISVTDVTRITGKILTGDTNTSIYRVKGRDEHYGNVTPDHLVADAVTLAPGAIVQLPLRLESSRDYTALQFDLRLPDGVTVADDRVAVGERAPQHVATALTREDGVTRVVMYSNANDNLANNDAPIVYLTLQADESLEAGAAVTIDGLLLCTDDYVSYVGEQSQVALQNPSGVNDLALDGFAVYAAAGKIIIDAPAEATAQIVAMNGMWRDVEVTQGHNEVDASAGIYVVRVAGKSVKLIVK